MKPNAKEVGVRIYKIRKFGNYTMEEFGQIVNNSPKSSVNNWEKGVSIPQKPKLKIIAILGRITVSELLFGSLQSYVLRLIQLRFPDIYQSDELLRSKLIINIVVSQGLRKKLSYKDEFEWIKLIQSNLHLLDVSQCGDPDSEVYKF